MNNDEQYSEQSCDIANISGIVCVYCRGLCQCVRCLNFIGDYSHYSLSPGHLIWILFCFVLFLVETEEVWYSLFVFDIVNVLLGLGPNEFVMHMNAQRELGLEIMGTHWGMSNGVTTR